ncbi:glycoside hydrolase family 3 protein [Asticcacaulis sp. EMRT-3]|uniref:glycoside hydrolase family 3 protein n=1 Tax=Asticcacaulis sp. EMRT-3 TaxID=3040349 RepID=UPI0024AEB44B|nr:glycoside hydrolase family 3 protein [Asticcacaulis sp. EMRT-3]MDI7776076.1 glycoside hydrolase family 3 N-terminal domain-containing protein [Asticcacaulis sp. EMRT-3]
MSALRIAPLGAVSALALVMAMACSGAVAATPAAGPVAPVVHPQKWPDSHSPIGLDAKTEAKITALLKRMSLEEKVGQVIQPEIRNITPEEVTKYHIGTIENGGGSWPGQNKHATVADWVKASDTYYQAALKGNAEGIPLIWASDAVHGHNNVFGATLFPHNIALGAAHDPELIKRIGAATAEEVRSTGLDWAFAPTIAVARDDRWGRTYESYSEDPKIVAEYAAAMVEGLQGTGNAFLDKDHVIATAKHFLGDGSTDGGRDQGDSLASEDELIRLHAQGYASAIDAGVQSVMASYNSWHGIKMHANKALLTDVLKGRMGFDGMIMGDWNAHGQIPGCTNGDCPISFNAGLDIFNAPTDWKALDANMIREVKDGTIPMSRLDDAVRRILRVKFRAHVFDEPSPANRPDAGKPIGTPAHRAIARQAVAESLVLLKNDGVLPLKPSATILIAGDGADNIAMQSGGWTSSWQGTDNTNADFPGATSIYQGLKAQIEAAGGQALYSPDGTTPTKPDAAIIVFGETPYAEFMGDQPDVALHHDNADSLALIKKLKAEGVPVVAVMLSGRPLYVNPQINAADAFVAAWLPGSEGEGVADVLLGHKDFTGRLAFSWPKRPDQTPLNVGDANYDPQFAYGYGLSYAAPAQTPQLPEVADTTKYGEKNVYFTKGDVWNGYKISIGDANAPHMDYVGTRTTLYGHASLTVEPQADGALHAVWNGKSQAWLDVGADKPSDIAREANGAMMLAVTLRINAAPSDAVQLGVGSASVPISAELKALPGGSYQQVVVPLSCFSAQDLSKTPTVARLETAGTLDVSISDVRLVEVRGNGACPAN